MERKVEKSKKVDKPKFDKKKWRTQKYSNKVKGLKMELWFLVRFSNSFLLCSGPMARKKEKVHSVQVFPNAAKGGKRHEF